MARGIKRVYAKTEADFVPPPLHAVWMQGGRGGVFALHKDMIQIKSEITATANYHRDRKLQTDAVIYEWRGDEWVEVHRVPAGTVPKDHYLWKTPSKRGGSVEVPQRVLDETLASILESHERINE